MTKKLDLVRFSGTLPVKLANKLKEIAFKEDRSMNTIYNWAIARYCENYDEENTPTKQYSKILITCIIISTNSYNIGTNIFHS